MSNKYSQNKANLEAANNVKQQKKKSLFDDILSEPIITKPKQNVVILHQKSSTTNTTINTKTDKTTNTTTKSNTNTKTNGNNKDFDKKKDSNTVSNINKKVESNIKPNDNKKKESIPSPKQISKPNPSTLTSTPKSNTPITATPILTPTQSKSTPISKQELEPKSKKVNDPTNNNIKKTDIKKVKTDLFNLDTTTILKNKRTIDNLENIKNKQPNKKIKSEISNNNNNNNDNDNNNNNNNKIKVDKESNNTIIKKIDKPIVSNNNLKVKSVPIKEVIGREVDSNGKIKTIINGNSLIKGIIGNLHNSNNNNNINNNEQEEKEDGDDDKDKNIEPSKKQILSQNLVNELKEQINNSLENKYSIFEQEREVSEKVTDFVKNFEKYYSINNNEGINQKSNKKKKITNNQNETNIIHLRNYHDCINQLLEIANIDIECKNEFIIFTKACIRYSKVQKKFISLKYVQISKKKIKDLFESIEIFKEFLLKLEKYKKDSQPSREFIEKLLLTIKYYICKPLEMATLVMIEAGNINGGILGFGHFAKISMIIIGSLGKIHSFINTIQSNINQSILNLNMISNKI
ncbi:hypothetical protein RB653_005416 [Dictyostelium firmibasis]|uniref:Uncharacterized protein n=1 Tax=Dictyostelium firmibasis TaxID=79012 RepID=A0AAN7U176_9MYCE